MKHKTALFLFIAYVYLLVKIIVFKFHPISVLLLEQKLYISFNEPAVVYHHLLRSANFIPFDEITRSVDHTTINGFINLFGNIALFIPFGFLLPFVRELQPLSWRQAVSWSFLLSLSFEIIQGVLSIGTFDVDDIVLNTCGGLIGFGLCMLLSHRKTAGQMS